MRYLFTNTLDSRWRQLALPGLLRSLLSSLIVLALPPGAGVALIALASALAWRLPQLLTALACKRARQAPCTGTA